MNERCVVAIKNPCAEAQETMDQKFWEGLIVDARYVSTIVTVNK
jgi:hypothetical protein